MKQAAATADGRKAPFQVYNAVHDKGAAHMDVCQDMQLFFLENHAVDIANRTMTVKEALKPAHEHLRHFYSVLTDSQKRRMFFPTTPEGWLANGHGTTSRVTKRARDQYGCPANDADAIATRQRVDALNLI